MFSEINGRYLRIVYALIACLFISVSYAEGNEEKHAVDTYNHLTTSFSMLREGIGTEAIRRDILDNLEQSKLTPQTKDIYKSLLELCDVILINKEKLKLKQVASTQAQKKEKQSKLTSSVMKAGVSAVVSGGTSLMPSVIGLLTSGVSSSSDNSLDKEKLNQDSAIRKTLTAFEFKLSTLKSEIKNKFKSNNSKFTRTTDLSEYIKIKSSNSPRQTQQSSLLKLHLNSPSAYMVTHDLALYELGSNNYKKSRKYLLDTINNAPSIISRLPIRGKSNSMLGSIELEKNKDKSKAKVYFESALNDIPDDYMSLFGLGIIASINKQYDIAKGYYERLLILHPNDANLNYAYTNYLIETAARDDKIVQHLKKAISGGFNVKLISKHKNIKPYLAKLDLEREYKINVSYGIKWNMLRSDVISLTNVSSFDLSNVSISVLHREHKKGRLSSWFKYPKGNVRIHKLSVGQTIKVKSFNTTKKRLYDVRVEIKCDQGGYKFGLKNRNGQLVATN